jgi:hypothetical protein
MPGALVGEADFKEFEQTNSASMSVVWAGVVREGRIS